MKENTPSPTSNQKPGTKSQILAYLGEHGIEIARAHRYLLPDGSLGGSHKPDPKHILHEGVLYKLDR